MKKLLTLFAIALAVMVSSCSKFDDGAIWEKFDEQEQILNDHEKRIAALEELCRQLNTNIDALQTIVEALEKKDYVTNVSPVREDGEIVGYTISFANSDTITIYNGKDGVDGTDGKDGYTPQIGVMKDTDGIYYWTLDGEWLLDDNGNKIKAVGEDGRDGQDGTNGNDGQDGNNGQDGVDGIDGITPRFKIENDYWYVSYDEGSTWIELGRATGEDGRDGQDGTNGNDGQDGADGKDGITPRLKIENDYWYVSYDEGATWIELGRATGEDGADGSDGTDGSDGDSIFSSVTQDDEYVYFILADGTMITLPKHDKENIQFEDLRVKAICCKNWDTNNDGELSYAEAAAVTDIGTVFKGNTNIITFTEFRYFTGISFLPASAFSGCTNLWKIIIPDNVIIIMEEAFYECSQLSNINIPDRVATIGDKAFFNCSEIKHFIIPQNVTSIGGLTFSGCSGTIYINCPIPDYYASGSSASSSPYTGSSFDEIIIGNEVTSIGDYAFYDCRGLTSITIPDSVVSIGDYAFYDCRGLTSITIPDSVVSIGDYAFSSCYSLTSITIPDGVTSIGDYAFYGCSSLASITIPDSVVAIGDYAFFICTSLTSITIPDGVTEIGGGAFRECINLMSITIPNSVTEIGDDAFFGCKNLISITIPNSVTEIRDNAFRDCINLTSITIPNSVTEIGERAFFDCENLIEVYCKATTPPSLFNSAFNDNASGRKIYVPRESVEAYKSAGGWKDYASAIVGYDF